MLLLLDALEEDVALSITIDLSVRLLEDLRLL
jgi:hypothetical protein